MGAGRRAELGFTLLEVIVVLVITSLTSVVVLQGLSLVMTSRASLNMALSDLDQRTLLRARILTPIQGLVPDFDNGEFAFSGTENQITGLTITPLLGQSGRPTPFTLTLSYDTGENLNVLSYQESDGGQIAIARWQGERAKYRYIGQDGTWSDAWPGALPPPLPGTFIDVRPPQLPQLVALVASSDDLPDLTVPVHTRRTRLARDPPM
jgi:prepilin-type N-terminal cleavage/methylation domain-containing protein